jgi:hypothetical protein
MYSQNDEQKYIDAFFQGHIGNLLDIGAYDGKTFSNTLSLLEKGWTGTLVEPSPSVFIKLVENTKQFNPTWINCAVSVVSNILKFMDSGGDAISSLDQEHVEKWIKGYKCTFTPYYIKTITLGEIFRLQGFDFKFINLDIEGKNYELFQVLVTDYIRNLTSLKMLCIEHDGKHAQMEDMLKIHGFRKLALNGENIILVRD